MSERVRKNRNKNTNSLIASNKVTSRTTHFRARHL